jgi:antitoxin component YwqK of YwqJK toxin-antitoxin module
MKLVLSITILLLIMSGCKINRYDKHGRRTGKWMTAFVSDSVSYKRVEYYQGGKEKRTWKMYHNNKLVSTEKYRNDTCYTKFYYPDGKLNAQGKSVMTNESADRVHWYYIGRWQYYNKSGKLELIKIYKKDDLNPEEIIVQ